MPGKAGNEYILAFTDTEEHTDAKNVVEETQNDTSRHMVVVIMGEGSTKQTEYSQVKNSSKYVFFLNILYFACFIFFFAYNYTTWKKKIILMI